MNIHESIQRHADRVALLAEFRRTVRAIRRDRNNSIATEVRRRLLSVLSDMMSEERDMLQADRQYLRNTTEDERAHDDAADPASCEDGDFFVSVWDGYPLLDMALTDPETQHIFDPASQQWFPIAGSFPLRLPISDERLGELAPIIQQIEIAFEIRFVIELIFFDAKGLLDTLSTRPKPLE
ncbi:hypothetical protein [Agrobacterium sp. P15N1-A]|uniref:hypothetical protein n=1 Tax=Agrobacterium sp. P15N1-A TaxID=3342820 RepID=UPI0037D5A01E